MMNKCVAAGHSSGPSHQVSLFKFPRDFALRNKWTRRQVQRTIASWNSTDNFSLCSELFTADCFKADTTTLASSIAITREEG